VTPLLRAASCLVAAVALTACQRRDEHREQPSAPPAEVAPPRAVDTGWNEDEIAWRAPTEGLAEAQRLGRPACLVVFTTWCPHCTNYRRLFADRRIVAAAEKVVMIRVDADQDPELSRRFAPDGEYIPRTMFLTPAGALRPEIRAGDGSYAYFFDEDDPAHLLGALERAAL
jgi:protein-disulfide reductase (glutathione)